MPPRLVVWSDYVCPFCYVGHDLVKRLKAAYPDVDVEWRPFELNPGLPPERVPLDRVLPPQYRAVAQENLRRVAAAAGLTEMRTPEFTTNSQRAHVATAHAAKHGVEDAFREAVMRAYWVDERNVGDWDVLRAAWDAAGAPADAWDAVVADADATPRDHRAAAAEAGVTGVPTFDVIGANRKRRVVGAQPFETIARVVEDVRAADEEEVTT